MPQTSIRLAITLATALLILPIAAADDSPAPVQEPAASAGLEAPAAPGIALEVAQPQRCDAPVVTVAPALPSAECPTTRCFVDSNCDSYCGGAGFGVCMNRCCFCAG